MNAVEFKKTLNPYCKKYRFQKPVSSLYDFNEWIEVNKKLSDSLINSALNGEKKISYFSSIKTKCIGIDIDDHHSKNAFDENGSPGRILLERYKNVVNGLGAYPSILFKSNRGLHCYYLFTDFTPHEILERKIKNRLSDCFIEILPTPNSSLRIDPKSNLVNPKTFEFIKFDTDKIEVYELSSFLDCSPLDLRKRQLSNFKQAKGFYRLSKLEKLEESIIPVLPGTSNENIFKTGLLPAYYRTFNGNIDETVNRIQNRILIPSNYVGELTNTKRLSGRVASSFRKFDKQGIQFIGNIEQKQTSIESMLIINEILNSSPFSKRRNESLKLFLENLFYWKEYQDSILNDKRELIFWDWFYKNYTLLRKKGFYPIPSVLMKSWNLRYSEFMDYLKLIGILRLEIQYRHENTDSFDNHCRYYSIHTMFETKKRKDVDVVYDMIDLISSKKVTKTELCKKIKTARTTLDRWMNGTTDIPKKRVEEIGFIVQNLKM